MGKPKNFIEDVWKYINKGGENECWEWLRSCNTRGYGNISINNKMYKSHRVVYELIFGKIPVGMHVLHHCDNRKCCNPNHLFLGNNEDNIRDKIKKGRQSRGERSNNKLKEEQVLEIRKLYSLGNYSQKEIARKFGVGHTIIGSIVTRKKWKHI